MTTERMGVNPLAVIGTLASIVRTDNGNRYPGINALLDDAEQASADVAELARAAKVYFDGYCADEADDHFDPGEPRGEETGCTREQHRAAKDLRAALAPFTGGAK